MYDYCRVFRNVKLIFVSKIQLSLAGLRVLDVVSKISLHFILSTGV
jgi:hypothetical protein